MRGFTARWKVITTVNTTVLAAKERLRQGGVGKKHDPRSSQWPTMKNNWLWGPESCLKRVRMSECVCVCLCALTGRGAGFESSSHPRRYSVCQRSSWPRTQTLHFAADQQRVQVNLCAHASLSLAYLSHTRSQNTCTLPLPSGQRWARPSWRAIWREWWPCLLPAARRRRTPAPPSARPTAPIRRTPPPAAGPERRWAAPTRAQAFMSTVGQHFWAHPHKWQRSEKTNRLHFHWLNCVIVRNQLRVEQFDQKKTLKLLHDRALSDLIFHDIFRCSIVSVPNGDSAWKHVVRLLWCFWSLRHVPLTSSVQVCNYCYSFRMHGDHIIHC